MRIFKVIIILSGILIHQNSNAQLTITTHLPSQVDSILQNVFFGPGVGSVGNATVTGRKFNDGFYVLLNIAAEGNLIAEIERRLRVSEQVIKFITVRMDEEEKRLGKIKAHRDTHVKRSSIPVSQPQAAPAHVAAINAASEPSAETSSPGEPAIAQPETNEPPASAPRAEAPVEAVPTA